MYLVLNFKSNLGTYEHDLLAYERDARGRKFAPGCSFVPGCKFAPGANCAHEHGFSQLIIHPIVCCTCPYFVWCINLLTRIKKKKKKKKKKFGQSLYKLLLKGTYCFGAGCVDLGVTDERKCPMIHAKYYVHRPSGS